MKELQQKQKIKRRLYSLPALCVLLIITILAIKGAYGVVMKDRESAQYVSDLKTKMETLNTKQAQLKADIDRLGTSEGVDSAIKQKFTVAEPGEKVAVILDRDLNTSSTTPVELNWLQKLWRGFLDLW